MRLVTMNHAASNAVTIDQQVPEQAGLLHAVGEHDSLGARPVVTGNQTRQILEGFLGPQDFVQFLGLEVCPSLLGEPLQVD